MTADAVTPRAVGLVGLTLHAAVGVWPFLATCLRAPAGPAAVLALWWAVLAAVAVTTFRSTPRLTPVLPAIALAMWAAVVLLGAAPPPWNAEATTGNAASPLNPRAEAIVHR